MTLKSLLLLCLLIPFSAIAQELPPPFTDDFDEGNLKGWKRYVDGAETAEIVDGVLEIADAPSGTGRVAFTLQESQTLVDFVVETDILPQIVDGKLGDLASHPGLLARFNGARFSGYGMNIRRSRSSIEVWKYTNGSPNKLRESSFTIPFDKPLHLVFKGVENELTSQVYDGDQLVGEITVSDSTYASGFSGAILYFPAGEIARFDNFKAYHPDNPPRPEPKPIRHEIMAIANPSEGGSVSGDGTFDENSTITLTATPNDSYRFAGWMGDGLTSPDNPSTTLTITQSQAITATFIKVWEVTISPNIEDGGTVTTSGSFDDHCPHAIEATPAEGYHFVRWEGDGIADPTASKTEVIVTSGLPIQAVFEKTATTPPREAEIIRLNPVIEGVLPTVQSFDSIVTVQWPGGGHLQRWQDDELKWEDISNVSPYQEPAKGHGIFRVRDPWDGGREVNVTVPGSYDPETPIPLVVLLHGYFNTPFYVESFLFKMKPLAESRRFIYTQPNGTRDDTGNHFWNAIEGCCDDFDSNVDDARYLRSLVAGICERYNVDERRIYFVGHSNGGAMANTMACQYADVVAGFVNFAGFSNKDETLCVPSQPVHALLIGGTLDPRYADDTIQGGKTVPDELATEDVIRPGLLESFATWGAYNGHTNQIDENELTLDLVSMPSGNDTRISRMTGGAAGGAAELWTIEGGEHTPRPATAGSSTELAEHVIDWLFAHPKPQKQPFTISGTLTPCEEVECQSIAAMVEGIELREGANARNFFKEVGTTNGYGDITAEYAFDMTYVTIEGFEAPVPVMGFGRVLMTAAETGDTIYWEQETQFTVQGPRFTATMLRGTGALKGLWGRVNGVATIEETGFSYTAEGWWWPGN